MGGGEGKRGGGGRVNLKNVLETKKRERRERERERE